MNQPGGYLIGMEKRAELLETAREFPSICRSVAAPDEIDPRTDTVVENQGQQGACQGHALSSVVEHCYRIATGDKIQLSRQYAYIGTQRIDGITGDSGSTISGGVRLAKERGIPLETVWPYPGRYVATPPGGWDHQYREAAQFKIGYHTVCASYDDVFAFLASGQGGISIGISWGVSPVNGVVEQYTPSGGGHAVSLLGYSKRKDSRGRNYIWLLNSWGAGWGNGGWAEVAPSAIDAMARAQWTVMIGLSDMVDAKPRKIDWKKASVFQ